ncbi:hypothetical protein [Halosolutus gelatinilyticus]|uniref:hypothetical protein n=1 Tax=Halosolutus gelatinilyticus TaxID=2931975 RepID=UPI001FF4457A|nr:hypothetical protein [Halosolutus gelatinilyticus]
MVEQIKRRTETDGCACLECRGVDSIVARRGIGDVFLWALGVLPSRPSIPLLFLALAAARLIGHLGSFRLELALAGVTFAVGPFVYCYAATLAAGAIADRRYAPTTAVAYALRRSPAVIGTMLIWFVVTGILLVEIVLTAVFAVSASGMAATIGWLLGTVALFGLLVVAGAKSVLAPTAAIVGGYGPIAAFRVSWGIVSLLRRATILLVGLVLTIATAVFVSELGTATEPYPLLGNETVRLAVFGLSTTATFLSTAISALVLCHLYVQGVLE